MAFKLGKQEQSTRWLIEGLWLKEAVGIIGGEPKSYKTFVALHLAAAVASGVPCFGKFAVHDIGRALVFCGEDSLPSVRARLEAISILAATSFVRLNVHVITAPSFRLDLEKDREMLNKTIAFHKPKLLVLDPFVRLHRIDENKSGEVAPLLSHLRELQRVHNLAIALVHHAKKGGKKMRGGQSLRGSSEFHAWGDTNLYPRRVSSRSEEIELEVEHRNGAAIHNLFLRPVALGESMALGLTDMETTEEVPTADVKEQIVALLAGSGPMASTALRAECKVRKSTMIAKLDELVEERRIQKQGRAYALVPVPVPDVP